MENMNKFNQIRDKEAMSLREISKDFQEMDHKIAKLKKQFEYKMKEKELKVIEIMDTIDVTDELEPIVDDNSECKVNDENKNPDHDNVKDLVSPNKINVENSNVVRPDTNEGDKKSKNNIAKRNSIKQNKSKKWFM